MYLNAGLHILLDLVSHTRARLLCVNISEPSSSYLNCKRIDKNTKLRQDRCKEEEAKKIVKKLLLKRLDHSIINIAGKCRGECLISSEIDDHSVSFLTLCSAFITTKKI